jgi:hypothetical protein
MHRLGQVIIRAGLKAGDLIPYRRLRREHQDGDGGGARVGPQAPADLQTIHIRHHHVQDDQVRLLGLRFGQGLGAAGRREDPIAFALQQEADQLYRLQIIIHHHNRLGHAGMLRS